jgi:hypothetical protein
VEAVTQETISGPASIWDSLLIATRMVRVSLKEAESYMDGRIHALEQVARYMAHEEMHRLRDLLRVVPFRKEELMQMSATAVLGIRGMSLIHLCTRIRNKQGSYPLVAPPGVNVWNIASITKASPSWMLFQHPREMLRNRSLQHPVAHALGMAASLPDHLTLISFFLTEALLHGREGWDLDVLCRTSSRTSEGGHVLVGPAALSDAGVRVVVVPDGSNLNEYAYPLAWLPKGW